MRKKIRCFLAPSKSIMRMNNFDELVTDSASKKRNTEY